jgi:hypothetical protein
MIGRAAWDDQGYLLSLIVPVFLGKIYLERRTAIDGGSERETNDFYF